MTDQPDDSFGPTEGYTKFDLKNQPAAQVARYTFTSRALVETFHRDTGLPSGKWVKSADYDRLRTINAKLVDALKKIAFAPFGAADASHVQVLADITACARAAIAKAQQ